MTAILISTAFGLASFCLIIAVFVKAGRPVRLSATQQNILDFSAVPVAVPAAPLRTDGGGDFLQITANGELKFPKMTFRPDNLFLRAGGPLAQRFRPLSMQGQNSPVADQVQNIAAAR